MSFFPQGSVRRTDFPASECPPGPLTPVDAPQSCSSPSGSGSAQEDDAHAEKKVRLHWFPATCLRQPPSQRVAPWIREALCSRQAGPHQDGGSLAGQGGCGADRPECTRKASRQSAKGQRPWSGASSSPHPIMSQVQPWGRWAEASSEEGHKLPTGHGHRRTQPAHWGSHTPQKHGHFCWGLGQLLGGSLGCSSASSQPHSAH